MGKKILIMGGIVMDRYFLINRLPGRGEDAFFYDEFNLVGGCMTNMAATVKNLGAPVYMVSCIGSDPIGKEIAAYIDVHEFDRTFLYEVEGISGSCLIFSEPDGERTFIGRNEVDQIFTDQMQKDILEFHPEVVGLTGFYLVGKDAPRIVETVKQLHEQGSQVLFDPSSLAGDVPKDIMKEIIELSDVLTPNHIELDMLKKGSSMENLSDEAYLKVLTDAGKVIFFKEGAKGGTIYTSEGEESWESVPCNVVDTNGAGDSFAGGLLYGMAEAMSWKEMAQLSAKCAAKNCEIMAPHGFWRL